MRTLLSLKLHAASNFYFPGSTERPLTSRLRPSQACNFRLSHLFYKGQSYLNEDVKQPA